MTETEKRALEKGHTVIKCEFGVYVVAGLQTKKTIALAAMIF